MPKKKYVKKPFPRKGVDWNQVKIKKKDEEQGSEDNIKSERRELNSNESS